MLLDIAKLPTAENSAIHLHPTDDIDVARVPVPAGSDLRVDGVRLVTRDAIPAGHKVALRTIHPGELVLRYGQTIGRAKGRIEAGDHVHTHNLSFEELHLNYEFPSGEASQPEPPKDGPTFLGYRREDGRVGTRNYIAVVAASNCAAQRPGIWAVSALGGPVIKLRDDALPGYISPDGSSVPFTANLGRVNYREIWRMDSNGAYAKKLLQAEDDNTGFDWPGWTPDGRRLTYIKYHETAGQFDVRIESSDLKGGLPATLYSEMAYSFEGRRLRGYMLLPDGRMIVSLNESGAGRGSIMQRPSSDFSAAQAPSMSASYDSGRANR